MPSAPGYGRGLFSKSEDPHEFISLSCSERRAFNAHVRMIKSMGAELWLDDIKPDQFSDLADDLARFDGVKIDKSVILEEPSSLSSLIADCARYVQFVLVEGVENSQHYEIAEESGSHFLRGIYVA